MTVIPRSGSMTLPLKLDWVRKQLCQNCGQKLSTPHHCPSKGALGAHRDDLVCALCVECHDDAQQYKHVKDKQRMWAAELHITFLMTAPVDAVNEYWSALWRWREDRAAFPY